ncbi:MAG: c-type cytochrome [Burkholderiaceae bacterium]|jgi:cytochrome c5|nr:c-type cytochrome [Burkholderiaceae bacterium]
MKKASLGTLLVCSVILVACGKQDSPAPAASSAPATPPAPAATAAPAASAAPAAASPETSSASGSPDDNVVGKSTYGKVCVLCHGAGIGGAPLIGNKGDWGPRIAQGKDVLYKHVLEGFTGQKGTMPPRGGSNLSDDEIKAGVDYMVARAQQGH